MSKAEIAISAVDQTKAAFESAKRNLAGLGEQASALPSKFGTLGLAIAGVFSAATVKGAIDVLDAIDDLSEKTGISTENLSALRYAGEVTGTTFESLAGGISKLSKGMAEAAGGGKEAAAVFAAVGVAIKNNDGTLRSQDDVLGDLADKFKSYNDGTEKAALAQKIFGKSGAEMIPLLNQGSAGIARLRAEAVGLGAVYGGDLAKAAAEFNDNLKKLELNAEAAKVSLAGGLLPALNKIIEGFIRLKSAGLAWIVIKDAAMDVVGLGRMSSDPGADVQKLNAERTRQLKDLDFAKKKGLATRGIEGDLRATDDLLEVSKLRQANRALSGNVESGDRMSRLMGAGDRKTAAPVVKTPDGSAAAAANKELKEQAKLLLELAGLSGTFTEDWDRLSNIYAKGGLTLQQLTDEQAKLLGQQPAMKAAAQAENEMFEAMQKRADESRKDIADLVTQNDELFKSNQARQQDNEEIGLTTEQLQRLTVMRLNHTIANKQATLVEAEARNISAERLEQMRREISLLEDQRALTVDKGVRETKSRDADDNKQRTEAISASISDGLLDGFRNGGSAADIFLRELKAQFAKTTLQPLINPIVSAGNGLITSALQSGGSSVLEGLSGLLKGIGSWDGGGPTGNGVRTGGLDGKGGFLGVLHPNETVLDHTKGQGMVSGGNTMTYAPVIQVAGGMQAGEVAAIVRAALTQNNRELTEQMKRTGVWA